MNSPATDVYEMKIHTIPGSGGLKLHVREYGQTNGRPLVFVHGWSQSYLSWVRQYQSALADEFRIIVYDLRGHGQSEAPNEPALYQSAEHWAGDLQAILLALKVTRPVIIGWSYGSLVAAMHAGRYGDAEIAGLNFVGGACRVMPEVVGTLLGEVLGEVLPKLSVADLAENIAGMRRFVAACFTAPLSREDYETALCYNIAVSQPVRAALLEKPIDTTAILSNLKVPLLISHGRQDAVTLPAMAELAKAHCTHAELSWYDGVGHGPFIEAPERFNRELAAFARRVA